MNLPGMLAALAATFLFSAHAQTSYEKMEVGNVIQDSIGIGSFVKPIPLPAGEWLLVHKRLEERILNPRVGDPIKLTYVWMTLKSNKMDAGPVLAMVLSFTPDSRNISYGNGKCESKNPRVLMDDFGTNAGSVTYLCGTTSAWSGFRKSLLTASDNQNAWIRNNLTVLSAFADEFPEDIVLRTAEGSKFRGRNISYTFVTRREGSFLNDPAYTKYATDWTHADGQVLEKILDNSGTKFSTPEPFVAQK